MQKYDEKCISRKVGNGTKKELHSSVLDTKETFGQFSGEKKGYSARDFQRVRARYSNLELANILESSSKKNEKDVKKAIRRLRYCSSVAMVEDRKKGGWGIRKVSKKCRHPLCSECSRVRANRMRIRFLEYVNSEEGKKKIEGKKAYFLTLTLRHGDGVREGVYLDELKKYTKKLVRSAIWKKYFGNKKGEGRSGWFLNYEMTAGKKGLHIHSHALVVSHPIKGRISDVQEKFRAKWKKITGDSDQLRIDLAGKKKKGRVKGGAVQMVGEALEIFKYTVKGVSLKKGGEEVADLVADWVMATKGKNMITAGGMFRGLGITAAKGKREGEPEPTDTERKKAESVKIGRTSKICFSYSVKKSIPKKRKKEVMELVRMMPPPPCFLDVTEEVEDMELLLLYGMTENEVKGGLSGWVDDFRMARMEVESYGDDMEISERQLALFDHQAKETAAAAAWDGKEW